MLRILSIMLLFAAAARAQAPEETPRPNRTGIQWIDWAAEQVEFVVLEAEPAEETSEKPEGQLAPTHSVEAIEMMRLQQEVRMLRELIEDGVAGRIATLESEVRELRSALKSQRSGMVVPRPEEPSRAQLPEATASKPAPEEFPAPAEKASEEPAAPFTFTVVDEWGRSPEVVAELGGSASTLIGLAGLVPPGSARADLVGLAGELREKYRDYDNMVIEIFDDEQAALDFAETQKIDAGHRVLSLSRSRAEGRDLALYYGGTIPEALPAE